MSDMRIRAKSRTINQSKINQNICASSTYIFLFLVLGKGFFEEVLLRYMGPRITKRLDCDDDELKTT